MTHAAVVVMKNNPAQIREVTLALRPPTHQGRHEAPRDAAACSLYRGVDRICRFGRGSGRSLLYMCIVNFPDDNRGNIPAY